MKHIMSFCNDCLRLFVIFDYLGFDGNFKISELRATTIKLSKSIEGIFLIRGWAASRPFIEEIPKIYDIIGLGHFPDLWRVKDLSLCSCLYGLWSIMDYGSRWWWLMIVDDWWWMMMMILRYDDEESCDMMSAENWEASFYFLLFPALPLFCLGKHKSIYSDVFTINKLID